MDDIFLKLFRVQPDELPSSISSGSSRGPSPSAASPSKSIPLTSCCPSLDRLTLLACNRQGILPEELLVPDVSLLSPAKSTSFSNSGSLSVKDATAIARETHELNQRMTLVALVGKERRAICRTLFSGYYARLDREQRVQEQLRLPRRKRHLIRPILLSHEENKLHTELSAMESNEESLGRAKRLRHIQEQVEAESLPTSNNNEDGSATSAPFLKNPKEYDAVRSLLDVQSSSEAAERKFEEDMAHITMRGERRIAKIRQKQINDIIRETEAIKEREQMLKHLEEREKSWRRSNEEKKQALHLKVLEEDRLREEKVARHEEEAMRQLQERKRQLMANIAEHNARIAAIHEQRERDRGERVAKLDRQLEEGRLRAEAKRQEAREQAELLKEEVTMKLELHGSRKRNIDTRRHLIKASAERVHTHRLHQALQLKGNQNSDPYFLELDMKSQQRLQQAAQRKEEVAAQRAAKFKRNVEGHSQRRKLGQDKQYQIEAERIDWCSALDHNWEVRKAHVDDVLQSQKDAAELLAEANKLRMEAHAANLERIRRADLYNQRVRKAVVETQDEHIAQKKHADDEQRFLLKQSRVVVQKQQETMLMSLEHIRNRGNGIPSDPDELRKAVDEQEMIQRAAIIPKFSSTPKDKSFHSSKTSTPALRSLQTPPPKSSPLFGDVFYVGDAGGGPTPAATPPTMDSLITKRIRRPASTMF